MSKEMEDVKPGSLPPPDERNLGSPSKPPLGFDRDASMSPGMDIEGERSSALIASLQDPIAAKVALNNGVEGGPSVPDIGQSSVAKGGEGPIPEAGADVTKGEDQDVPMAAGDSALDIKPEPMDTPEVTHAEPFHTDSTTAIVTPPLLRSTSEDQVEVKMEQIEQPRFSEASGSHTASSAPPEVVGEPLVSPPDIRPQSAPPTAELPWSEADRSFFESLDPAALESLALAALSDSPPFEAGPSPPPPPPEDKGSKMKEFVDVDLGRLRCVSRNHARIIYRTDLEAFCIEIFGRNGAWIDNNYFVRGSIVPLHQGYVIFQLSHFMH
jgi:hypothetical protein